MVLPHRSRRESNLRKTPLSDNVWQGRFYIVFKGNVYFDEREQNRLVFKGRLRWIFQMLIVGNHHLSMMQHRNMFNYQRFSILIGTNKFLTKNSFSMYKCKPLFFSFLLILFVQPFFIQILYISKRLVSGFFQAPEPKTIFLFPPFPLAVNRPLSQVLSFESFRL